MNWETAGIVGGIVTSIVGVATAYLRLSIAKAIAELKNDILEDIDRGYVRKDVVDLKIRDQVQRFLRTRRQHPP